MGGENPLELQFNELHRSIMFSSYEIQRIDYRKIIEGFLCNKEQGKVLQWEKIVWFLALNK